jgi:hypothetical protein
MKTITVTSILATVAAAAMSLGTAEARRPSDALTLNETHQRHHHAKATSEVGSQVAGAPRGKRMTAIGLSPGQKATRSWMVGGRHAPGFMPHR